MLTSHTPILDFVKTYADSNFTRFHMPGHKGHPFLGCEPYDITEIKGADALYEAEGIIAQSETNATALFGTQRTFYSTEGSSQCIRAMMYLAMSSQKRNNRPYVIAARNAHKAFLYAAALLDLDVLWLYPEEVHSICSCMITPSQVEEALKNQEEPPIAVYLTSPDYLGGQLDIVSIAEICHQYGTLLTVDNAHGAYLHFLKKSTHPMDLGADLCCDSAHKTLPVLTGGAYLHIGKHAPVYLAEQAKQAMILFGSTSPSYLLLCSLDMCNSYLMDSYSDKLDAFIQKIGCLKKRLRENGWKILETDPLKLTIQCPSQLDGLAVSEKLRVGNIECEYADSEYIVLMLTIEHTEEDLEKLVEVLTKNSFEYLKTPTLKPIKTKQVTSIRNAIFHVHESIPVEDANGRICGVPTVSCPPAIPIVVSGERIDENAIKMFQHYKIEKVDVIRNS